MRGIHETDAPSESTCAPRFGICTDFHPGRPAVTLRDAAASCLLPGAPPTRGYSITAQQERDLYAFIKECVGDDAYRYQVIAQKVQRTAGGTAAPWEIEIVDSWLTAMQIERLAQTPAAKPEPEKGAGFPSFTDGLASNPRYQAFLDTLEQQELDALGSNAPYMEFISQRMTEFRSRHCEPQDFRGHAAFTAYVRDWADARASGRARASTSPYTSLAYKPAKR